MYSIYYYYYYYFLPILPVLKPEAVSVPDALKLVQDDAGEHGPGATERLQQASREELQFGDISPVQLRHVPKQLQQQQQQQQHRWGSSTSSSTAERTQGEPSTRERERRLNCTSFCQISIC